MKNNAIVILSTLPLLVFISACNTQLKYQQEPSVYPVSKDEGAISYLELTFPVKNSQQLALQLALVKYKKQAAKEERWLLLHQIPYQWLRVKWQKELFYLLAVGPFNSAQELMSQRRTIQQGVGGLNSMPAIALLEPSSDAELSSNVIAEVNPSHESNNKLNNN